MYLFKCVTAIIVIHRHGSKLITRSLSFIGTRKPSTIGITGSEIYLYIQGIL